MSHRETELVERIIRGDQQAMAEYLQLRRPDLMAVILGKMGPALRTKLDSDDIFQEVCVGAIQNMADVKFTDQGPFGWLCEIANRRIIDADRRFSAQKRAAHKEVGIHAKPEQSHAGLVNLLVASITSPSKAFSRQQREFTMLSALDQLPAEQKRVLQLRYGQGKPSREIAEQIGKSDGATRVLITRALQKLKALLEETSAGP